MTRTFEEALQLCLRDLATHGRKPDWQVNLCESGKSALLFADADMPLICYGFDIDIDVMLINNELAPDDIERAYLAQCPVLTAA